MPDAGIGQAAGELLEEMKKAQADMQQQAEKAPAGPNEAFQRAMDQAHGATEVKGIDGTQQAEAATKASNVLMQARTNATTGITRVGEAAKTEQTKLTKMLDGLLKGQDKMTQIIDMALSGRQFSPPELLVMQAAIFRCTQELELTGKVIEKATSGVKQTLNTQV